MDIPTTVKQPQDHLKPAAQREAEGDETAVILWREHTFEIPAQADEWDADITLAFEEGKSVSGVRGLLGPKQWAELHKTKPKNKDIGDLFEHIAKALGFESAGN